MKRALSIWFPMLAIDLSQRRDRRLQRTPPDCILLISPSSRGQIISHCCERAAQEGVRPGLTLSQARAVFPATAFPTNIRVEEHDPERDKKALAALAVVAQSLSPITSVDEPDGLLADVTGCARVFENEEGLIRAAKSRFADLGFRVRAAIAPTYTCAQAAARFGRKPIIPDGAQREALSWLPVRALRCDPRTEQALQEVGLDTIGQVLSLPRSVLPARFGEELLFRIDQALGHAIETIDPVHATDPIHIEQMFEGPTDQFEAIQFIVRDLLSQLCDRLQQQESGTARMLLRLERSDDEPLTLRFALSTPTRDLKHLWSLIRPRLERANLGFGVEAISITSTRSIRIEHRQKECWQDERSSRESEVSRAAWMDAMVNRLGVDRVVAARPTESYVPERAAKRQAAKLPGSHRARSERDAANASQNVATWKFDHVRTSSPRPSLILHPPESALITALSPDGPVINIRWRGLDHPVSLSIGPERIEPEWWRTDRAPDASRDYFRVQDSQGRWLWLFRQHEGGGGRWFVHGVWA